jgi:hypothetical protein
MQQPFIVHDQMIRCSAVILLRDQLAISRSWDILNNQLAISRDLGISIDTRMNNQVNAKILADEQLLIIKQTVGVPLTKFLEVINARLLAFKNILKDKLFTTK